MSLSKALDLNHSDLKYSAELGYAYAVSGDEQRALTIISTLKKSPASLAIYLIAEIYTGLGDKEQAFSLLNKAYDVHFPFLSDFRVTPQFDVLRSDPRYAQSSRRMNL